MKDAFDAVISKKLFYPLMWISSQSEIDRELFNISNEALNKGRNICRKQNK